MRATDTIVLIQTMEGCKMKWGIKRSKIAIKAKSLTIGSNLKRIMVKEMMAHRLLNITRCSSRERVRARNNRPQVVIQADLRVPTTKTTHRSLQTLTLY
jgi:hypothetical protein